MKKKIAIGCVALIIVPVLILVIGGFMMSPEVRLSIEVDLQTPPDELFPFLSTQEGIERWWAVALPATGGGSMAVEGLDGPAGGVGTKVGFTASGELVEDWEILSVQSDQSVTYLVDFKVFQIERVITLAPTSAGAHVTWVETANFNNPVMRWFKLMPAGDKLGNMTSALVSLDQAAQEPTAASADTDAAVVHP